MNSMSIQTLENGNIKVRFNYPVSDTIQIENQQTEQMKQNIHKMFPPNVYIRFEYENNGSKLTGIFTDTTVEEIKTALVKYFPFVLIKG